VIAYGGLAAVVYGFWIWQPYQIDFFPRPAPKPNPTVDPDLAHLFSSGTKVLVVTAHPDDSAFYIGGFLTQLGRAGAEVHQIICTDGDKAYYWIFADPEAIRPVRRKEAIQELRTWGGKDVLFLGRPDGRLRADDSLVRRIRQRIDEIQPEYIVCFDEDYPPRVTHQDHRRSGGATELAAKGAPSVRWILHFSTHAPNWICNIDKEWEDQRRLLQIHASQFRGKHLQLVVNMVEDTAMREGELINSTYGEGFRCERVGR
jgi:LmbE family N-acetylglucosaminyl deacetylase